MDQSLGVGCHCTADLKDCIMKVQTLKYSEEACYNGTLLIKAFSSGLDIGACNWTIKGPQTNMAYLSSSVFWSVTAMKFDYHALEQSDLILYSDFSLCVTSSISDNDNFPSPDAAKFSNMSSRIDDNWRAIAESLLTTDESSEDMEKLDFICSCSIDSIKEGGSVLIPIGRLGIVLQLLDKLAHALQSSNLDVPIFFISSVAEELLAFSNIIPEWLCEQRQERLYSGQPLFVHEELRKEKRLHLFSAVHSLQLLKIWQEPCIIFCPHWSLRLGPAVHLLRHWSGDPKSLLVLEEGLDADIALLPFKPISMKVLQCSFVSGIKLHKLQPLINILQPKLILFPSNLRQYVEHWDNLLSFKYYSESEMVHIPDMKASSEIDIATELVTQLHCINLKDKDLGIARLQGELVVEQGKHRLLLGNKKATASSPSRQLMHWGMPDMQCFVTALQKMGINASVERSMNDGEKVSSYVLRVLEPKKALIEVKTSSTVITTDDEGLASLVSEAIHSILNRV